MQLRTQLVVIGLISAGWLTTQFTSVSPFANQRAEERERLGQLESRVETHPEDVDAARALSARYLDLNLLSLLLDKIARMHPAVQKDPRVALHLALAHEHRGELNAAFVHVNGALNRCNDLLADAVSYREAGCDAQTQGQLAFESEAIDRMLQEHVDPLANPDRAQAIREMLRRPVRLGGF